MKNLYSLNDLTNEEIMALLDDAICFRKGEEKFKLSGKIIANCFFEPSTRTQYSFNTAELMLDAKVLSLILLHHLCLRVKLSMIRLRHLNHSAWMVL